MQTLKFKLEVSYFVKGTIKKTQKDITASSSTLAWRMGLGMIPVESVNQVQIKVSPLK